MFSKHFGPLGLYGDSALVMAYARLPFGRIAWLWSRPGSRLGFSFGRIDEEA